jgi:hypothetical protein
VRPRMHEEDFVSRQIYLSLIMAAGLLLAGAGLQVTAQQTPAQTPQTQPSQTQPPQTQPGEPPNQAPGQTYPEQQTQPTPGAQVPQSQGVQTFQGMIVKSGDKYVLQDESTARHTTLIIRKWPSTSAEEFGSMARRILPEI